jgi:hypothetical protein
MRRLIVCDMCCLIVRMCDVRNATWGDACWRMLTYPCHISYNKRLFCLVLSFLFLARRVVSPQENKKRRGLLVWFRILSLSSLSPASGWFSLNEQVCASSLYRGMIVAIMILDTILAISLSHPRYRSPPSRVCRLQAWCTWRMLSASAREHMCKARSVCKEWDFV